MNQVKINYFLDLGLLAVFLSAGITGIMLYFGISFRSISNVHAWSGIALVVLVALHLALHLNWIICTTKALLRKKDGKGASSTACSCIPQPCLPEHANGDKT